MFIIIIITIFCGSHCSTNVLLIFCIIALTVLIQCAWIWKSKRKAIIFRKILLLCRKRCISGDVYAMQFTAWTPSIRLLTNTPDELQRRHGHNSNFKNLIYYTCKVQKLESHSSTLLKKILLTDFIATSIKSASVPLLLYAHVSPNVPS